MFSEGDMAVYPAPGVGVIKSVEMQTFAGIDQTFYVLEILENYKMFLRVLEDSLLMW